MRYYITDQCDNCFECLDVCPTHAILRPGEGYETEDEDVEPQSYHTAYIVQERCNGCGEQLSPRCLEVCTPRAIYVNMLE